MDHLTGSNIVTNASGTIIEASDYYPYGAIRIDEQTGFNEQRKFAGHEYDAETGLSYMQARYYNGNIGRFVSQDPVFLVLGNQHELKSKTGLDLTAYLSDPQGLNSYSYARNNPLNLVDPQGAYYRESSTGYNGIKGYLLALTEDFMGVARGNLSIILYESTIDKYANAGVIKSIIFEEQSHGIDDIVTDRFPIFGSGKTVGLGQITINDGRSNLGYGSYTRDQLLDPHINISEMNNRINSIINQLKELGITRDNENYVGYIGSAYNNQNNLGVLSDYGRRVQAYYNDISSGKALVPENTAAGEAIQIINTITKKSSN